MDSFVPQTIHHFDFVEVDHGATLGTTRNVPHQVSLNVDLHRLHPCHERHHHVVAWFRGLRQDCSAAIVHPDRSFWNFMQAELPKPDHQRKGDASKSTDSRHDSYPTQTCVGAAACRARFKAQD